jgi:hypothetical protein
MLQIVQKINSLIEQIEGNAPAHESLEWYLLNNLEEYRSALEVSRSKLETDNATRMFCRFCTESMDWETPLYKSCMEIASMGWKLANS